MLKRQIFTLTLFAILFAASTTRLSAAENLLRNGSFEGGTLYWHNIRTNDHQLVRGNAKVGEHALRIQGNWVMSAPFVAKRGADMTVSFWVKGEREGEVHVQMPPSAREVGQRAKRLWTREAGQKAKVTTEWQRVSFTWPADVPQTGFWPNPHYMVQFGARKTPILIDGVTVTLGKLAAPEYLPRREIEVVADCPDLPGYEGAKANLFDIGATVRMTLHASNPGSEAKRVKLRWQLFDYEGERPVGETLERTVTIDGGKSVSETADLKLAAKGCVIARLSAHGADGALIDSSDFPLTSLPYPKAATKPDWRERFGGSFAGGLGCVQKFKKIGFGWIRWRPHMNGEDHLPNEPRPGAAWEWRWFDKELDEQEAHGCSTHCVLHPPPKWIMEKGHPLPKDMRWAKDDPRWEDLSVETVWDKFVKGAVTHYKGRSLIYEIQNEPDLGSWSKHLDEYARFTIRTARLIRQTDPEARIMVNNVYGIPSRENAAFLKAGGAKHIDVFSWHDYHGGWLADASSIRRMLQNLEGYGGKHIEIWFNEGWSYNNTLVDEPTACLGQSSAQGCNAAADSIAELTVNGQEKTILFHVAYETHGMSFWDYSGPGTMLWDWYNYPLPLVAAWNVLTHHISLSDEVGFVRPPHANFCIFDDLRNERGVMIAYADRDAKEDVTVELPDFGAPLTAEDIMGNATPASKTLVLSRTGRPVILYSAKQTPGKVFLEKLEPLDRKHASFVSAGGDALSWTLPPAWEGSEKGSSEGSVASIDGKPVWKLEQVWPPDPMKEAHYRAMVWTGTDWNVAEGGFGGQPGAKLNGRTLNLGTRAPHGKPHRWRVCGLTFVAPQDGTYSLNGTVTCRIWDGKNKTALLLMRRGADGISEAGRIVVANQGNADLNSFSVALAKGESFTLLPKIDGMFAGGSCLLSDLRATLGERGESQSSVVYRLPAAWQGVKKGSVEGNPICAEGNPVWRIDRVYPDKPLYSENYFPVPWDGTAWHPSDHQQGGQPKVQVENGKARLEAAGPWANSEYQKIAGIVFIAPESGIYRVQATASSKPWTGGAKTFRLAMLKKDTQRAAEIQHVDLPRDNTPVAIDFEVELTTGHELVFLPLMPHWNNATGITLEGLTVTRQ